MSNILVKSLLLAVVGLLYTCGVPEKVEISSTGDVNRLYLYDAKERYQRPLVDFMSDHNFPIEIYDQGNMIMIKVHADKIITRQLIEQFKEAGIYTTVDYLVR